MNRRVFTYSNYMTFKLDKIESCFGYFTGCFVASLLAMTTQDWLRRRKRDRCKIIMDCLSTVLQFAGIPLSFKHLYALSLRAKRSNTL